MTRPETNSGSPVTSMPLKLYAIANSTTPTYTPDIYAYVSNIKKLKKKTDCIDGKWSALVR
jgi:hypothetical protein